MYNEKCGFIFHTTHTNFNYESTLEFHPTFNVGDGGPIEFYIPLDEDYPDLNSHILVLRCKIMNSDCSDLKAGAKVLTRCVNYPLHAMFSK